MALQNAAESVKAPSIIALFGDVLDTYDPTTDWLDGMFPAHPGFDSHGQIQDILISVKGFLLEKILDGCTHLMELLEYHSVDVTGILNDTLHKKRGLWKAVVSGHKYGVIYLCSRSDARSTYFALLQDNPYEAKLINNFLSQNSAAVRVINYGIRQYLHDTAIQTTLADRFVPRYAIAALGPSKIAIRRSDFLSISSQQALHTKHPMYDLHDFAHMVTATLEQRLYANTYQSSLCGLKFKYTSLVTSPGINNPAGLCLSDGILFSEFLTGMFAEELCEALTRPLNTTYQELVTLMASQLAEYLLGERELSHSSTGTKVALDTPISPSQLAVLAQNKPYELPASEIEQRVFTRGGPIGETRDELDALDPLQRIEALATSKKWMYFEVRKIVKHRAQKEAYRLVAEKFIQLGNEDWEKGKRLNLWDVVADREKSIMARKEGELANGAGK